VARNPAVVLARLAKRHLGRALTPQDGCSELAIRRVEKRLGIPLPKAIRAYYSHCGRNARLNRTHNFVRSLAELSFEDGHLMLMDENQAVVSWGIPIADLGKPDPVVWQRDNTPPITWYSEEKTWSELLESMFEWYTEAGAWTAPRGGK
jgi:hypothetical protein